MDKECPRCHQSNMIEKKEFCVVCCGQGSYDMAQDYAYGCQVEAEHCGCCGGTGYITERHCSFCGWSG
ncbi:MAG: hypothetical protein K8S27_09645 [Candidatus Omnitrophica bacterium]|nr:hypothetical protein [Candidatus Omnitrophota bacterium]